MNPTAPPDDFLQVYFSAEKYESLLFLAIGIAAVACSWVLYRRASPRVGMIGPLLAIGAIQIAVGGSVFLRTDMQVAELQRQRVVAPAGLRAAEATRMATVMANFRVYKAIEVGLLVLGAVLVGAARRRPFWHAFGIGLLLQSALMLVLDLIAEERGRRYLEAVLAA
jgi:hypothetical protein